MSNPTTSAEEPPDGAGQGPGTDGTDISAGEYVLGLLSAADARTVEARLDLDAPLRHAVYAWQDQLLPLTARSAAVQPSATLWMRIAHSVADVRGSDTPPSPQRARAPTTPWWQRLGLWQGLAGAAVASAVLLAVALTQRMPVLEPQGARYLTVLQSPQTQATGWIVEMRAGGTLRLVPVGDLPPPPAGRTWQFWTKAQSATAPTSLGLVRVGQTLELPASQLPALEAAQLFEITLEPEGGSTIGRPTGPILYVGRSVKL